MKRTLMTLAAVAALSLASSGCSDTSPEPGPAASSDSFYERAQILCAFELACDNAISSDVAIESCLTLKASDDYVTFIGDEAERDQREMVACLSDASDCADYDRCVAGANPQPCQGEKRCEGDVLVRCETLSDRSSVRIEEDCTQQGLDCVDSAGARSSICSLAGTPCGNNESSCQGDYRLWCPLEQQEVPSVINCADEGLVCRGQGLCVDQDAPDSCSSSTCDGSAMEFCIFGRPLSGDCARLHPAFTCKDEPDEPFAINCEVPQDQQQCDEGAHESSCAGDIATVCVDGLLMEVDCGRAGATCVDLPSGVSCAPDP